MSAALRHRLLTYLDQPLARIRLWGRLARPLWRSRFLRFGRGSVVHRPVVIHGSRAIAIGRGCVLLRPQLSAPDGRPRGNAALQIGDRVIMRPYASIRAAESVTIEDDVSIASLSTVTDATPDVAAMSGSGADGALPPVRIGRGTAIGQRVAVLAGSNVGRHCYIEANSVVSGEIPDCSIVAGAPARVVGRTRAG
jgi:acetyltransferase-like isoleucine patch superfamily enzyme